jgi:hypothetical protein
VLTHALRRLALKDMQTERAQATAIRIKLPKSGVQPGVTVHSVRLSNALSLLPQELF